MPIGAAHRAYNGSRRTKVNPPHVPIRALRIVLGIPLDTLAAEIEKITGVKPSRGTLSAIESGNRGASTEMLHAIERAYGLEPGMVTTNYQPRAAAVGHEAAS